MKRYSGFITTLFLCTALAWGGSFVIGCSNANDDVTAADLSQSGNTTESGGNQNTSVSSQQPASGGAARADWPQFRGVGGLGVAAETTLPTTWSENENLVWKTALPGAGTSSPIIIGDRIFLTCYRGFGAPGQSGGDIDDLRLDIVSMRRDTGDILWTKTVTPVLPEQESIRDKHGYSSSTPVADGERVYVFFGKSGVFAFDYDGNRLWHADVGSKLSGWGSAASPVLFGDLLIVNASVESESLVALDKNTGTEKWRVEGIRQAWNTPLLMEVAGENNGGNTELIVPIVKKVLAFDPATGKSLWTCDTGIGWYMVPSLIARDDIIYCIGGRSGDSLAIRAGGRGDVTNTHLLWARNKGSNVSSPILHQQHLYWVHEKLGIAYCVEAPTGKIMYEQRMPRAGQFYASPVLADGKLYYINRGGTAFVVAAKPEFQLLATNELESRGRFDASPAVADDRLFLRSNRFLYCIGENAAKIQ